MSSTPASLKTVGGIPFAPTLVSEVGDVDARVIAWTAYLGAMPTARGFATWSSALSRASAGRVAALNYLIHTRSRRRFTRPWRRSSQECRVEEVRATSLRPYVAGVDNEPTQETARL